MQEIEQQPATRAVSLALLKTNDPRMRSDLLFLEAWEMHPSSNLGMTLKASQIRQANPDLAAAIDAELKRAQASGRGQR